MLSILEAERFYQVVHFIHIFKPRQHEDSVSVNTFPDQQIIHQSYFHNPNLLHLQVLKQQDDCFETKVHIFKTKEPLYTRSSNKIQILLVK